MCRAIGDMHMPPLTRSFPCIFFTFVWEQCDVSMCLMATNTIPGASEKQHAARADAAEAEWAAAKKALETRAAECTALYAELNEAEAKAVKLEAELDDREVRTAFAHRWMLDTGWLWFL